MTGEVAALRGGTAPGHTGRLARGLETMGRAVLRSLAELGSIVLLVGRTLARAGRRPRRGRAFLYQVLQVGIRSLPLALTTSAFAGMVMALQFGFGLQRFGARIFIGQATVTALFRELAPILTALIVGSRVGAGIAAELGGMAVTEQIDAVRALGADPLQRLVAPRLISTMLALPVIAACADVVGYFGGMLVAAMQYDVSPRLYMRSVSGFVTFWDFGSGLLKAMAFAFLIGALACREGLRAYGGTEGVGRATTRAVVASSLSVLIADFLISKVLLGK